MYKKAWRFSFLIDVKSNIMHAVANNKLRIRPVCQIVKIKKKLLFASMERIQYVILCFMRVNLLTRRYFKRKR